MVGPSPRKTRAADDLQSSPAKRAKKAAPPSDNASSTTTASDDLSHADIPTDQQPAVDGPVGPNNTASIDAHTAAEQDDLSPPPVLDLPPYVEDSAIARLERLHSFREPDFNRYGIGYLPATATWGDAPDGRFSPTEHLLCYRTKPLVVWMVGIVRTLQLTHDEQFSVGLQLLCELDDKAAKYNAFTRCKPEAFPGKSATLTFANKWLPKKKQGTMHTFDEVYNAVDRDLRGWDEAAKIPADRVNFSDIVLVECYVRRYKNKELNEGKRWTAWKTSFSLLRIALVVEGEQLFDEPLPESSAVI